MKKAITLIIFLTTIRQLAIAQLMIGPQAGFDLATVTGSSFTVSAKPGWSAGVFISIPFSKHFSLMPAALYSMRGFKYSYDTMSTLTPRLDSTITITTTVNVNASLGYLDVPALFTFFAQESKGFMIQAGPQISFLITDNSTITNTVTTKINNGNPQTGTPTTSTSVSFQKTDISLMGGIGYKLPQLLLFYARVSTGFAKAQSGQFQKDANVGHNFVFQAGAALCFGAK